MSDSPFPGIPLPGLVGTNPLGFLAALGVQALFDEAPSSPSLWWQPRALVPRPVVDESFPIRVIIERAMTERHAWIDEPALTFEVDGHPIDDVKFEPAELRRYLALCSEAGGRSARLAAALVADGSFDRNGAAKPTDLHFTAGQQRFIRFAREIVEQLTPEDVEEALEGPWKYQSPLPSFMWDVTDDRIFALSATNPSTTPKLTVPGAEFLALVGLTRFPVFAGVDGTDTTGCSGQWKGGIFMWPLWAIPAGPGAVRSLLSHVMAASSMASIPSPAAWGIDRILSSTIRRSEQGGYGTFGPPRVEWEART